MASLLNGEGKCIYNIYATLTARYMKNGFRIFTQFNFRHDDLINENSVYAEMWAQQSQAENGTTENVVNRTEPTKNNKEK